MNKRFLQTCIKHREFLSLSIEDVGDILGISPSSYRLFEEGKIELEEELLRKIVKLYCIDIKSFNDFSSSYDLSEVPDNIKDVTIELISLIEGDENA